MINTTETIEKLMYIGLCTVIERQTVKDPVTKISKQDDVTVLTDQKCRLLYKSIYPVQGSDGAQGIRQQAYILVNKSVDIKAGCKIAVTQNGKTTDYEKSGMPAIYETHQEIMLVPFTRWA